jgi:hypothetical protein
MSRLAAFGSYKNLARRKNPMTTQKRGSIGSCTQERGVPRGVRFNKEHSGISDQAT